MRTLRALFDFYLDASIHVGLAVASLVLATTLLLNISVENSLLGFTFFSTIVCYNFIKYGVEAKKYLIVSKTYHKRIQVFSFLSFFPALWFLYQLNQKVWITVLALSVLCVLYAIPFFPKMGNLRNLAGFKIYLVGLVWAGFTVLLPVIHMAVPVDWDVFILCVQRFLLVIILMLPFEVRDMETDFEGLWTIPQILGVRRTKMLGVLLSLLLVLLTFFKDGLSQNEVLSRLILGAGLLIVLFETKRGQSKYVTSFWIEAIPIVWAIFLVCLEGLD